jgi:hypothetical protein
MATESNT